MPSIHSRAKKEGAVLVRVSGEAVGCPVRTTEKDAPNRRILHSVMALTDQTSYIPPVAKTMRRTQSLELSDAYYTILSPLRGGCVQIRAIRPRLRISFRGKELS